MLCCVLIFDLVLKAEIVGTLACMGHSLVEHVIRLNIIGVLDRVQYRELGTMDFSLLGRGKINASRH
jgi:hypothetical protein